MSADRMDTVRTEAASSGYGHLFRLLHWVVTLTFLLLLVSGLSLHAIARPDRSFFSGVLPDYLWSGRVALWHLVTALVFAPALLAMVVVTPRRVWTRPISALLLGGGLLMIATGLLLFYRATGGELGKLTLWLHSSLALLLLPFAFSWHTVLGLTRRIRLLIPSFHPTARPQGGRVLLFLAISPLVAWLMLGGWPLGLLERTLVAVPIPAQDSSEIVVTKLPWDQAVPLTAYLANGAGLDAGQTEVTLRALHNGDELFVLAQWNDPTEDRRYTPWQKTPDGWEQLKTTPGDEYVYYEDKFSMILPIAADKRFEQVGCALYCHAGGGNPYGCKYSDRLVDVWHWKAVRTDPVGQADDKYWHHSVSEEKLSGRYGDPKEGGGYKPNAAADQDHPAFLPADLSTVWLGAILAEQAIEYTQQQAAEISPGTIIPGMTCSPFQGDRGDVRCQSTHRDGHWSLFFRRKLATDSEYDVHFEPGRSYAFSCAAFDRATKRHAYTFATFRLSLRKA
jgi:hypothetical protein